MASKTDICNQALKLSGNKEISNIGDDTPEAKACALFYDDAKGTVLASNRWTFAQKRAALNPSGEPPEWGWDNKFKLPADFISLSEIQNMTPNSPWAIEGDYLMWDQATANIRYTADVEEGYFKSNFVNAFAAYLGAQIAGSLVESRGKVGDLLALYAATVEEAQNRDGMQQSNQKRTSEGQLTLTRRAYSG